MSLNSNQVINQTQAAATSAAASSNSRSSILSYVKSLPPIPQANTATATNSIANQPSVAKNQQVNINDFYNNYVQPVLVPIHYCSTPLIFFPNWDEIMVTEDQLNCQNMLENVSPGAYETQQQSIYTHQAANVHSKNLAPANSSHIWYSKMRQIILIEYSSYFDKLGFIRLKEDKTADMQIKQGKLVNIHQQQLLNDNHIYHFIKWIQQDGFLYITMSLESIYLSVKLGYCYRYRSPCKVAFLDDITNFLHKEFHVHSYIYDYHLTAINTNFSSSSTSALASIMGNNYTSNYISTQTSEIIASFLNQFVDFFSQTPVFSSNTVIKTVFEKPDNSLIQHQFGLIFDYIIDSKKKLSSLDANFSLKFKTL